MKKSALALACGLVALLSGCSDTFSNSDIVGTYNDNNPHGVSTLILKADGTSSQVLFTKEGKKHTASGKWTFDSSTNRIVMYNGLSYDDLGSAFGKPQVQRGVMNYPVEKVFSEGQAQILVDPDRGIAFSKIE